MTQIFLIYIYIYIYIKIICIFFGIDLKAGKIRNLNATMNLVSIVYFKIPKSLTIINKVINVEMKLLHVVNGIVILKRRNGMRIDRSF